MTFSYFMRIAYKPWIKKYKKACRTQLNIVLVEDILARKAFLKLKDKTDLLLCDWLVWVQFVEAKAAQLLVNMSGCTWQLKKKKT